MGGINWSKTSTQKGCPHVLFFCPDFLVYFPMFFDRKQEQKNRLFFLKARLLHGRHRNQRIHHCLVSNLVTIMWMM